MDVFLLLVLGFCELSDLFLQGMYFHDFSFLFLSQGFDDAEIPIFCCFHLEIKVLDDLVVFSLG